MRVAVLASGRGTNLQALIEEWQNSFLPVEFVGVGSDKTDAYALVRAQEAGIPTAAFPKEGYPNREEQEKAIRDWLEDLNVQLLILAGYMKVFSPVFLKEVSYPIVNIHPSLLPSFPGLHAQKQALEYGVKISGCTVHFVDEGMDSGPIIMQETVPVFDEDTEDSLAERILKVEHEIYPEVIRLIAAGKVHRRGRKVHIHRDS
ncbi:phosphoribosylglycinamide formyltransferase [Syntrophobotulus glycolicus]|uniref:phosphoribosylglycinamide formyltransferase n=1 Tax=Syntrophobotulus glycolicus TaxID=51197 RepID=UPI00059EA56E|nr:phosphoribosylglycinamide formyltransferase [Syntrophobotulus glycolicus]